MLLLLLFGIFSAIVDTAYSQPSKSKGRHGRSVGSDDTTIEEYPYMVQIEHGGVYLCAGSIISKHIVLTAAHCLMGPIPYTTVRSGATKRGEGGRVHNLDIRFVHDKFKIEFQEWEKAKYDVGVAMVKEPFDLDNKTSQMIALNADILLPDQVIDKNGIVAGWGTTTFKGPLADKLRALEVPFYSKNFCEDNYKPLSGIHKSQICAGHIDERNKYACEGDSGSPLVVDGKVYGVYSYSLGLCGILDYPAVYTEVAYVYDWIKKYVDIDMNVKYK